MMKNYLKKKLSLFSILSVLGFTASSVMAVEIFEENLNGVTSCNLSSYYNNNSKWLIQERDQKNTNTVFDWNLDNLNINAYQIHYNNLPSVEESSTNLQQLTHFVEFLEKAGDMVKAYNLEQYLGFRLIHSHFPVNQGEIMVEEYQEEENVPALVTSAQKIDIARIKRALPASWIISEKIPYTTRVFETSTDPAIKYGINLLQTKVRFLGEIAFLLKNYQLNDVLALAVMKKDTLKAGADELYVELNTEEEGKGKSTIYLWNLKASKGDLNKKDVLITGWNYTGDSSTRPHCYKKQVQVCVPTLIKHLKYKATTHVTK